MPDVKALILGVMRIDAAAEAVEWERRWLSWGGLADRIEALVRAYEQLDLTAGARVGIMLRNRPPQLCALYSTLVSDRCLVTVNPLYADAVVAGDLRALDLPVLVAERADLDRPGVREAVAAGGTAMIVLPDTWAAEPEVIPGRRDERQRRTSPEVMIEMLTSGTTGKPKRVDLTRRAFQHSFDAALHYEAGREGEVTPQLRSGVQVLVAPLTHIGGMWGAINCAAGGRRMVLLEKFRVEPWREAVARHRPVVAGCTAAGLRMILDADVPREDLASLRVLTAGAAPVPPALIDAFIERYGIPILANYGATEFAGPVAGWSLADFHAHHAAKRGSVGRLHRGVEARVVDPGSGAVLPAMAEGVLELRSAQLPDGEAWLRTTDKARLDDGGFLWITGRADMAINRGGFKIHADDVVRALEDHPAVREAIVVGISDERLGEVPAAVVLPRARADVPTEAEVLAFLRERLLPYQVPVLIAVWDEVPRTASMKPIIPEIAAALTAQRAAASA